MKSIMISAIFLKLIECFDMLKGEYVFSPLTSQMANCNKISCSKKPHQPTSWQMERGSVWGIITM